MLASMVALLAVMAVVFTVASAGPNDVVAGGAGSPMVVVYDGYGQPDAFRVSGRVLHDSGRTPEGAGDGAMRNLVRTMADLDSREMSRVDLTVTIAGVSYSTTSDSDGMFQVRVKGVSPASALPVGPVPVEAVLVVGGAVGRGTLHVVPASGVALISDIDDTVMKTWVTDKGRMAQTVLLKNGAQVEAVGGAAAAYRQARVSGVDAVFYVSSSPQNLYPRLRYFLEHHGFPAGPLFLKNLGDDSLLAHDSYKLDRLERIAADVPGVRFVLVGDSGERDPEIYREFRRRHPARVTGIIIRLVPGSKHLEPARFADIVTVDDAWPVDASVIDMMPMPRRQ
jgi:phosphatidate phosphatase APP1